MKLLAADSFEPIFEPLLGRRVGYVPTVGGTADLLVEMAALQLFAHFGVDYHIETLGSECEADVLVLAGGGPGPLCPSVAHTRLTELAEAIPVTLLPRSLVARAGVRLRRCHVRDRASLRHEPDGIVMPDLVLGLEVARPATAGEAQGIWLRCDDDGLFPGQGLGDPDLVCGTAVEYLALAGRFDAVFTDRPEFALAALVQGREATLLPSASPVNRSLYDTWLADLGCRWLDARDVGEDGASAVARLVAGSAPLRHPAAADPRRVERAIARCDAGLRAVEARLDARDRMQHDLVAALVAAHERLLRRVDDLQESLYVIQAGQTAREASAANDGAASEKQRRYAELVSRIRAVVRDRLPADAAVLVVSRGDDDLLRLFGRRAGHFPQTAGGVYAGHHPANAAAAVTHLLALTAEGWDHLLLPATAFWWLDHYAALAGHLHRKAALVHRDSDCVVFALGETSPWAPLAAFVERFKALEKRFPAILDWGTACGLAEAFPEVPAFGPPAGTGAALPYMEESVDVIALPAGDTARLAEARRVATAAIVEISAGNNAFQIMVHPLGRHAAAAAAAMPIMPTARPRPIAERRLP